MVSFCRTNLQKYDGAYHLLFIKHKKSHLKFSKQLFDHLIVVKCHFIKGMLSRMASCKLDNHTISDGYLYSSTLLLDGLILSQLSVSNSIITTPEVGRP